MMDTKKSFMQSLVNGGGNIGGDQGNTNTTWHKIVIASGLLINLVSSIAIIQINKYIYTEYYFSNMCLTCIHFLVTFLCLMVLNRLGMFDFVRVSLKKMLPMAISFCGYILLTNYSLQFNSIGTYQCIKALATPGVMIISIIFYKHHYSNKVKLTIVPVLLGVLFNSMFDLNFNPFGQIIGLIGVVVSSLYLVWIGEKQKELKLNALQLLVYQAPLSGILLALLVPFFEPLYGNNSLFDPDRSNWEWFVIISSGFVAFFVNISTYWIIGTTSALTYNMSGNVKFALTIIVGSILFDEPLKLEQIFSVIGIVVGLFLYSYFKMNDMSSSSAASSSSSDVEPLIDGTTETMGLPLKIQIDRSNHQQSYSASQTDETK